MEVEEEEEEEEYYLVSVDNVEYFTTDEENGDVFEKLEDDDIGELLGKFVNGQLKLN